jgi:hypothetical protein
MSGGKNISSRLIEFGDSAPITPALPVPALASKGHEICRFFGKKVAQFMIKTGRAQGCCFLPGGRAKETS